MSVDKKLSAYFSRMAKKSAKARIKSTTPEERKQIAANAANARWSRYREIEAKRKAKEHEKESKEIMRRWDKEIKAANVRWSKHKGKSC